MKGKLDEKYIQKMIDNMIKLKYFTKEEVKKFQDGFRDGIKYANIQNDKKVKWLKEEVKVDDIDYHNVLDLIDKAFKER